MITVHHLADSRSQRILWLLEELNVPYEVRRYERDPVTQLAPPELMHVHPLGKSPVIVDGERIIAETGAIIEYLLSCRGDGQLIPPPATEERDSFTYWLHYAEGSAMPPLVLRLVFQALPGRSPALVRPLVKAISNAVQTGFVDRQVSLQVDFWERALTDNRWFVGAMFTAADILMSFPIEYAETAGLMAGHPSCQRWLKRIRDRPAYHRALERGRFYTAELCA